MRRFSEIAFAVVATLLATAVVLQLYFAGMGVFSDPTDRLFAVHGWNGRIVLPLLVLLTILFAVLAKARRGTIWLTVTMLGLLILQTLIFVITGLVFGIGPETPHPPLAATLLLSLHPINGLAILVLSGVLTQRAWRLARQPARRTDVGGDLREINPTSPPAASGGSPGSSGRAGRVPAEVSGEAETAPARVGGTPSP